MLKKTIALVLVGLHLAGAIPSLAAVDTYSTLEKTANFVMKNVTEPTVGTENGEWAAMALSRSELDTQKFCNSYLANARSYIKEAKGSLSSRKITEYSRVIMAFTALGQDPTNISGYSMTDMLADFKLLGKQGINGYIFALLALESGDYCVKGGQTTCEKLISAILQGQDPKTGGFGLAKDRPTVDVTAMAITALSQYSHVGEVKAALERAQLFLSQKQLASGGFVDLGAENCESAAQVIIALSAMNIDCTTHKQFTKNGKNPMDALISYQLPSGGFSHIKGGAVNGIATDQALCALVAYDRMKSGKTALYDMSDVKCAQSEGFTDIGGHWCEKLISEQKGYGISGGHSRFVPDAPITRGEFAAALNDGFSLPRGGETGFTDVHKDSVYLQGINGAAAAAIVSGKTSNFFDIRGTLTREQGAAMLARMARYAGLSTQSAFDLSQFPDGASVFQYAVEDMGFCIEKQIIKGKNGKIAPQDSLTRAEAVALIDRLHKLLEG